MLALKAASKNMQATPNSARVVSRIRISASARFVTGANRTRGETAMPLGLLEGQLTLKHAECSPLANDIELSGEKEGAQRLTPSPLQ